MDDPSLTSLADWIHFGESPSWRSILSSLTDWERVGTVLDPSPVCFGVCSLGLSGIKVGGRHPNLRRRRLSSACRKNIPYYVVALALSRSKSRVTCPVSW